MRDEDVDSSDAEFSSSDSNSRSAGETAFRDATQAAGNRLFAGLVQMASDRGLV